MSTLVTRSGKGSPLTHNEVDTNFTNLNTDKVEKTAADITGGTINNTTIGATTPSTGVFTTLTAQTEVLKGTGQNLILQSQTFTNAYWSRVESTVTANSTTAPDSTSTATTLFETTANSRHIIYASQVVTSTIYTFSIYLKAQNTTFAQVQLAQSGVYFATLVNLSTGAIVSNTSSGSPTNTNSTITSVGNGWYRVAITLTLSASLGSVFYVISTSNSATPTYDGAGNPTYVGNASNGIFIWGSQFELGSVANTYIPTTTTAVYGTPTLSFSGVASIGLQSDGSLYASSAGTGNVRFYTNNIGQEQARVSHTASAVNYHQLTGSATGSGPIHSVAGSDTNIDSNHNTKGTGTHVFNTGGGTQFKVYDTFGGGTSTSYFVAYGRASGSPIFSVQGSDANINPLFSSKGSSSYVRFATGADASSGNAVEQLRVTHTASAVNYVQVTGGSTGNAPYFISQGSDTNVNLWYGTKGTGYHAFFTAGNGANVQFLIANTASAVNYVQTSGSTTGFGSKIFSAGSDTNIPLVLQPKGTGALQAQQTDSTATGGNARGANAVDWQMVRSGATQVASGANSFIGAGRQNTSSGQDNFVGSGFQNSATGGSQAIVVGGAANQATAPQTFIGGGIGNQVARDYSGIVSGHNNVASGYYNLIAGGFTNSGTATSAVTTQSATMNGTTAVTLSASNANIKVGQLIVGTNITFPTTYVAAISGTSLTLSTAASGSSTSTLSFFTPHGVVVGGGNNQATGSYSYIGGGGDAGTAANRNVASGDWSFVGGGKVNQATSAGSVVVGGGVFASGQAGNTSNGASSFVGAGLSNFASNNYTFVGAGIQNQATGQFSAIMGGANGTSRNIEGSHVFPACFAPIANSVGVSQAALLILGAQTTDATATVLRCNTSAASTTNQVILPNNSAYYFRGEVVSGVTGGGNTKGWFIEGVIKRGANAASTALVGTPTVTSSYADAGASTWTIAVTADTTNGGLAVTFTGQAGTTIRTVAQIRTTEMTY